MSESPLNLVKDVRFPIQEVKKFRELKVRHTNINYKHYIKLIKIKIKRKSSKHSEKKMAHIIQWNDVLKNIKNFMRNSKIK